MPSRCLHCGKRLGFFQKKPYCSEIHEDRYLETQTRNGLERLLVDDTPKGPPPLLPLLMAGKAQARLTAAPAAEPPTLTPPALTPAAIIPPAFAAAPINSPGPKEETPPTAGWYLFGPELLNPVSNVIEFRPPSRAAFEHELFTIKLSSNPAHNRRGGHGF